MVQAATRLMLASKKSSPIPTLAHAFALHISRAMERVSSLKSTTWSESQRTGRETWSIRLGTKGRTALIFSATDSVGW